MSLAKHRELLVLGTLHAHPMHGYGLVDMLEGGLGQALGLKRPAVYAVLKRLEERGWITATREQEGNLPPRSVYESTPLGAAALPDLVAACASSGWDTQVPLASLLVHLDQLDGEAKASVVAELLSARREALASLARFRGHEGLAGMAFELMERQSQTEIEMLERVAATL